MYINANVQHWKGRAITPLRQNLTGKKLMASPLCFAFVLLDPSLAGVAHPARRCWNLLQDKGWHSGHLQLVPLLLPPLLSCAVPLSGFIFFFFFPHSFFFSFSFSSVQFLVFQGWVRDWRQFGAAAVWRGGGAVTPWWWRWGPSWVLPGGPFLWSARPAHSSASRERVTHRAGAQQEPGVALPDAGPDPASATSTTPINNMKGPSRPSAALGTVVVQSCTAQALLSCLNPCLWTQAGSWEGSSQLYRKKGQRNRFNKAVLGSGELLNPFIFRLSCLLSVTTVDRHHGLAHLQTLPDQVLPSSEHFPALTCSCTKSSFISTAKNFQFTKPLHCTAKSSLSCAQYSICQLLTGIKSSSSFLKLIPTGSPKNPELIPITKPHILTCHLHFKTRSWTCNLTWSFVLTLPCANKWMKKKY